MKVQQRCVPNDTLSFDHKDYHVAVYTNRNVIRISVHKGNKELRFDHVTPEQFIALLAPDAGTGGAA